MIEGVSSCLLPDLPVQLYFEAGAAKDALKGRFPLKEERIADYNIEYCVDTRRSSESFPKNDSEQQMREHLLRLTAIWMDGRVACL